MIDRDTVLNYLKKMSEPVTDLYEDMATLNTLYEELCWDPEKPLEFKADFENNRIIITLKD